MFKKFKLPRALGGINRLKQRGQIFMLYAIFVPMLFFAVGMTFDLSWYYINLSRMQNAADAAVIAGAQTLIGENGNLYYYMDKTFVRSHDGKNFSESYQDTTLGDTVAKTYVRKNLSKKNSHWDDDAIIDAWTKNELYFDSTLLGDEANNFETLYYHIMLEEDVPHMLLNGWLEEPMNAKVYSVVKINHYIKGYDLFEQMKYIGFKRYRLAALDSEELKQQARTDPKAQKDLNLIRERTIYVNRDSDELNLEGKDTFDYLFASSDYESGINANTGDGNSQNYKNQRIINIDKAYPVRDYGFYYNYNILNKLRDENPAYSDLDDSELAAALAKDSSDPMFIFIESEKNSARQLIINVNVSNINEFDYRPIVLIYKGAENGDSYPVILNLNADFRGILYAPNSSVAINGNEKVFQGFVIAKNYVELFDGEYNTIEPTLTNDSGKFFKLESFNFSSSEFDSFSLVKLENYVAPTRSSGLINNLFIQPPEDNN